MDRGAPREQKRAAILQAAVEVFAQRGYFGARMRDVAQQAGIADGTLYLYFPSKEELLIAVLEDYARAFVERARMSVQQLGDARSQLRAVLERHLVSMERNRPLATVFQIELRHSRRFLRRVAKGQVAEYLALLQEIVRRGQAEGSFDPSLDPVTAARVIFGAVDELITAWVLAQRAPSLVGQLNPLLSLIFNGLCGAQGVNERRAL